MNDNNDNDSDDNGNNKGGLLPWLAKLQLPLIQQPAFDFNFSQLPDVSQTLSKTEPKAEPETSFDENEALLKEKGKSSDK